MVQARTDLLIVLSMICAGGLVSYFLARDFSRALRRLSRRVEQVAAGELKGKIPEIDRADEIGDVARALVIFREAIKDASAAREKEQQRAEESELRRQQFETETHRFEFAINDIAKAIDDASKSMDVCAQVMTQTTQNNRVQAFTAASASEDAKWPRRQKKSRGRLSRYQISRGRPWPSHAELLVKQLRLSASSTNWQLPSDASTR
jgi:HAMP domain-containing protein